MDNRPTVILADDNVTITKVICDLLGPTYNVVCVAADGEEAVLRIVEQRPDFAVLDISMPKLDGISIARRLRGSGSTTRVIFMTLIEDDDYLEEARRVGHGYVLKRRLISDLPEALLAAADGVFFCSQPTSAVLFSKAHTSTCRY